MNKISLINKQFSDISKVKEVSVEVYYENENNFMLLSRANDKNVKMQIDSKRLVLSKGNTYLTNIPFDELHSIDLCEYSEKIKELTLVTKSNVNINILLNI